MSSTLKVPDILSKHTQHSVLTSISSPVAVRLLREEVYMLQQPGSHVAEVVKAMGKDKVLVKVTSLAARAPVLCLA